MKVRTIGRILQTAAILFVLLYVSDWCALQLRHKRGTAYGTVEVHEFLATSLKGSKTEYDMTGTVQRTCTHSIFPHEGNPACWWLERHTSEWN